MALTKVMGQNFRVFVGGSAVPEATNCQVTIQGNLEDATTKEEKISRMSRLIELQRNCVLDANKKYVGKTVRVLCDQKADENGLYAGKTSGFKLVKFPCERNVYGQFVDVEIDSYVEAMLLGKVK
jgi:tRNA-2-methylthio-N6-dimethylallyladenosine synthase